MTKTTYVFRNGALVEKQPTTPAQPIAPSGTAFVAPSQWAEIQRAQDAVAELHGICIPPRA